MKQAHATIFDLIRMEEIRQRQSIGLIASENFTSQNVQAATGSLLTNKYAEGLPGKRYYAGCEIVDKIEKDAIEKAKDLFGASWVNVQPHSGSQANAAVMLAVLKPGDKILGFDLNHGGHLTHGSKVNFSGKLYQPTFYSVEKETGVINWDKLADIALREKPRLIICGASAYSRDWDYKRLRIIANQVGGLLLADIAHTAGLIAAKLLEDPLPHCHFITTTTHKTLRGPRGGMILMGQDFDNPLGLRDNKGDIQPMSKLLDSAVFPGTQGGPCMHTIAAKAIAFEEALDSSFVTYCEKVIENARNMAQNFLERGYQIVSGGTSNHLFLIDLRNKGLTGQQATKALAKAGIIVNKNMVPFDVESPHITSGIRLGTPGITTRRLAKKDVEKIVEWVDVVLQNTSDVKLLSAIKQEVANYMGDFPLFAYH